MRGRYPQSGPASRINAVTFEKGTTMSEKIEAREAAPGFLTLHVISDSRGTTAREVVSSAVVQFSYKRVGISTLARVSTVEQVCCYLDRYVPEPEKTAVFHTVLDERLRSEIRDELNRRGIASVDLLGPAMSIVERLIDEEPQNTPGLVVKREVVNTRMINAEKLG